MTIDPEDLKEFTTLPYPSVQTRKHVFGTDYAILPVMQLRDGFAGNIGCTTLAINDRVVEHGETTEESLGQIGSAISRDCAGSSMRLGLLRRLARESVIFKEPTGKPQ
jgi:hypothetical protein